jgi:hypothetical protein
VNKRGTPKNLVASHPGNLNAARHGVHSQRLIQASASDIEAELAASAEFSPVQLLALREVARWIAILDAIDRDLDERGLVDKAGQPRYLLDHRYRASRQLDRWVAKISETIERQTAAAREPEHVHADYVRELQRIALGQDSTASTNDRLKAIRELLKLEADAGHRAYWADFAGTLKSFQSDEEDRPARSRRPA